MTESLLEFYRRHQISPVRQDIRDLGAHFGRRTALYRHLGILPAFLRGRTVLEVGPGSGFNSLHTASLAAGRTHVVTAYFPSARAGVVGGAIYLVDYGDLESTDSVGTPVARVSPRNIEFLASYATSIAGPLVLGLSYKLIEFRVDCSGDCRDFPGGYGVTHALDVGGPHRERRDAGTGDGAGPRALSPHPCARSALRRRGRRA